VTAPSAHGNVHLDRPSLLVVDLQHGDADPASDYVRQKGGELGEAARRYYLSRLQDVVLPNTRRLLGAFRASGRNIVYARIQSLTEDGRDRGPGHKSRGIHFPPGSWEARILSEIEPGPNDVVVSKTAGSAFVGTGLADVLGNLGDSDLVVVGAVTGSCVQATVFDGLRLGRGAVIVVEDATAAWSHELQADAIEGMRAAAAVVLSTEEVLAALAVSAGGT
jgi:nicotinamidase-related amidase